jgi:hypothetical protein
MTATTSASPIVVPEDVQAFAVAQKVDAYLPGFVEAARKAFPGATIQVFLEDDPEIENDWRIVVHAQGARLTLEQALEARNAYYREVFAVCPAPLVCAFRLRLELAE